MASRRSQQTSNGSTTTVSTSPSPETSGELSTSSVTPTVATTGPTPPPIETPLQKFLKQISAESTPDEISKSVSEYLAGEVAGDAILGHYNVVVLLDETTMMGGDDDKIYSAVQAFDTTKPLLLVLHSSGGRIEPAYLISKVAREYSNGTFHVAVPRRAKSAATLICCGADVVHMGSMSELGPIDPQIDGMPALGLKHAVQHLAELVKVHPAATEMFAIYLSKSLPVAQLGYYERVAESSVQYAERLLASRGKPLHTDAALLAHRMVYEYKDHGFVIDAAEAEKLFGKDMIKKNSDEYRFSLKVYQTLRTAKMVLGFYKKSMYFIGRIDNGCIAFPLK